MFLKKITYNILDLQLKFNLSDELILFVFAFQKHLKKIKKIIFLFALN
jgi:hypothetical protein